MNILRILVLLTFSPLLAKSFPSSEIIENSTISLPEISKLKFFGEYCSSNENCVSTLTCQKEICACSEDKVPRIAKTTWSIRNNQNGSLVCAIRAGYSCALTKTLENSQQERKYSETLKTFGKLFWTRLGLLTREDLCVENSRCDGYMCVCKSGFYNKNGLCLKRRSMFEKCSRDDECGDQEKLICNRQSGRCDCPQGLIFDIRTLKCHIPAGSPCEEFNQEEECVPNSDCTEYGCACRFGFRKSLDGSCGLDYGLPCGGEYSCADLDLSCRQGRCDCKFWTNQYYNAETEECLGKVSAPCDLLDGSNSSTNFKCTENAICANSSGISECKCIPTFAEDLDGKCIKSYGADCEEDNECDEMAKLVCINGKCGCPDGLQVFDQEIRKCQGLVGGRCTNNLTSVDTFRVHGVPAFCIENSFCEEKVIGMNGRCKCKFGYEVIKKTRRCSRKSSKFMGDEFPSSRKFPY